jgi:hypothetical protein
VCHPPCRRTPGRRTPDGWGGRGGGGLGVLQGFPEMAPKRRVEVCPAAVHRCPRPHQGAGEGTIHQPRPPLCPGAFGCRTPVPPRGMDRQRRAFDSDERNRTGTRVTRTGLNVQQLNAHGGSSGRTGEDMTQFQELGGGLAPAVGAAAEPPEDGGDKIPHRSGRVGSVAAAV